MLFTTKLQITRGLRVTDIRNMIFVTRYRFRRRVAFNLSLPTNKPYIFTIGQNYNPE